MNVVNAKCVAAHAHVTCSSKSCCATCAAMALIIAQSKTKGDISNIV
jgi:hypothetical protein